MSSFSVSLMREIPTKGGIETSSKIGHYQRPPCVVLTVETELQEQCKWNSNKPRGMDTTFVFFYSSRNSRIFTRPNHILEKSIKVSLCVCLCVCLYFCLSDKRFPLLVQPSSFNLVGRYIIPTSRSSKIFDKKCKWEKISLITCFIQGK